MTEQKAKEILNEIAMAYAENGEEEKCEALDMAINALNKPCTVGDTIWRIDTDSRLEEREPISYTIDNIVICNDGTVLFKYDSYDGIICELVNILTEKPYLDYYRVFLTREAADAALEKMGV